MNKHQVNYLFTEKECLAAILAIRKFRPYVEGMPFTCITGHASLKWLMTMKDLTGRLVWWSVQLQGYDFRFKHRKGSENVVADNLSRIIEDVRIDPSELLGFQTTEFTTEDCTELVQDVECNREPLPDLKVDGGLKAHEYTESGRIIKRIRMEAVDPAKPDPQLHIACSFGPQNWPWWDDNDLGDPATPVLLTGDNYPGA